MRRIRGNADPADTGDSDDSDEASAEEGEGSDGSQAIDAQTRAELRTHARRLARITRLRALAIANDRATLIERIDAAEARETARHERRLEAIVGHPLAAAAETDDAAGEAADTDEEAAQ